jgi:hypothetical protein
MHVGDRKGFAVCAKYAGGCKARVPAGRLVSCECLARSAGKLPRPATSDIRGDEQLQYRELRPPLVQDSQHVRAPAQVNAHPTFTDRFWKLIECRFQQQVLIDTTPLPADIPKVQELGASSAPLLSASYFIGARCKDYNDDYMMCKTESNGRGEFDCMKEGRRVTRCAASV